MFQLEGSLRYWQSATEIIEVFLSETAAFRVIYATLYMKLVLYLFHITKVSFALSRLKHYYISAKRLNIGWRYCCIGIRGCWFRRIVYSRLFLFPFMATCGVSCERTQCIIRLANSNIFTFE